MVLTKLLVNRLYYKKYTTFLPEKSSKPDVFV